MKTIAGSALVLCATVCMPASTAAQTPVGALAIDEREGDQYGWAVDYERAGSAQQRALSECGSGCSVVLTFERCAAYAADQEAGSSAIGWAESYGSSAEARQRALSECGSRGGSGCTVRVWGCNGPVVEDGLGLDRAARRQVQEGLQAAGFDPGGADGMFGPRTRAAIRSWQASQGVRTTGYLDGASAVALRPAVATRTRERPGAGASAATAAVPAGQPPAPGGGAPAAAAVRPSRGAAETYGLSGIWSGTGTQEGLSWTVEVILGDQGASSRYPTLQCGGELDPISASATRLEYLERITFGLSRCVSGGRVVLERTSEEELRYTWYSGTLFATGNLTRRRAK